MVIKHIKLFTIPVYHHSFSTSCSFQQSMYSLAENLEKINFTTDIENLICFFPRRTHQKLYSYITVLVELW